MRIQPFHPFAMALVALCLAWAPSQVLAHGADAESERALSPQVRKQLARMRSATARYHDFDRATQAGLWTVIVPDPLECLEDTVDGRGGMGYHFINPNNIGVLDPARPQALIYEPEKDGSMRLVAVEFLDFSPPPPAAPPVMLGRKFHYNTRFSVWALHVWIWRHNPSGLFADYNPNVSCQYAF